MHAPVWTLLPGRFSSGAQLETMVMAPLMIPAAPKPATARPTINIAEETAAPQSKDPSSNIPKKNRNDHCGGSHVRKRTHSRRCSENGADGRTNLGVEVGINLPRQWLWGRAAMGSALSRRAEKVRNTTHLPNWYALAYQPTSGSELKVSVIRGIA